MKLDEFVEKIADELEDTDPAKILSLTDFKKLGEWDSLTALGVIAMIDEEFEVIITGTDIINSTTIEDLFNLVCGRVE
jgi:acyl carrier protein